MGPFRAAVDVSVLGVTSACYCEPLSVRACRGGALGLFSPLCDSCLIDLSAEPGTVSQRPSRLMRSEYVMFPNAITVPDEGLWGPLEANLAAVARSSPLPPPLSRPLCPQAAVNPIGLCCI